MTWRRKGWRHGAAMMVWMFFANLFDAKAVVAVERIDTANRIGSDARRTAATPAGRN